MKRILVLCGLLAASGMLMPGPRDAVAQPTNCEWCSYLFDIDKHQFSGNNCDDELSPFCMNCQTLNACHTNAQPGLCQSIGGSPGHWQCYYQPLAARAVDDAVEAGNTGQVLALAAEFPETVEITNDGYVLLLNCTGAVVRSIRLAPPESSLVT